MLNTWSEKMASMSLSVLAGSGYWNSVTIDAYRKMVWNTARGETVRDDRKRATAAPTTHHK